MGICFLYNVALVSRLALRCRIFTLAIHEHTMNVHTCASFSWSWVKSTVPPAWLLPAEAKAHILLWPSLDVCVCGQGQGRAGVAGYYYHFNEPRKSPRCTVIAPLYSVCARMRKDARDDIAWSNSMPIHRTSQYTQTKDHTDNIYT